MPRRNSGPRMYRRPGRRVWYASFSDAEKHISLKTEDEGAARIEFAKLLERRRDLDLAPNEVPLAEIVRITRERADTNNTPKTAYEVHLNLRRVLAWLEGRRIFSARRIDLATVEDYKTARRFKVSAARVNRELDSWRRAMKVAVELRCAPKDALDLFVKLREPRPEPHQRGLTKAELTRFLRAVTVPGYKALFRTALGSGLRDDELRHMDPGDVRSDRIVVTPKPGWTTKGYRFRTIAVSPATVRAARAYLAARAAGLNFDQKRVWKVMQAACKAAKVRPFSMHDLRRAWASHLLLSGEASLKQVSKMLGHAELATTERYLRMVEDDMPNPKKLPW